MANSDNQGESLGALSLRRLEVTNGAGSLTLDLRGDWQRDLDARIEGGVGEITVYLPEDRGVRVNVQQGIGEINLYAEGK